MVLHNSKGCAGRGVHRIAPVPASGHPRADRGIRGCPVDTVRVHFAVGTGSPLVWGLPQFRERSQYQATRIIVIFFLLFFL